MNRKQRRLEGKENKRNSKKNFQYMGTAEIPVKQIVHDANLKECDKEVLDLCMDEYHWREKKLVKQDMSKCIIMTGISYLDALTALRFEIIPIDDKVLIRNTMWYISNMINYFMGLYAENDISSIASRMEEAKANNETNVELPYLENITLYPMYPLPNEEMIDDFYAGFVVKHAHSFLGYITNAKLSDVMEDEEYVFKVLNMIIKKTKELLPEAQVKSEKFVIEM